MIVESSSVRTVQFDMLEAHLERLGEGTVRAHVLPAAGLDPLAGTEAVEEVFDDLDLDAAGRVLARLEAIR